MSRQPNQYLYIIILCYGIKAGSKIKLNGMFHINDHSNSKPWEQLEKKYYQRQG